MDERLTRTTELFVAWLIKNEPVVYDTDVKGTRRATILPLFQDFCLANREHFRTSYGITWKDKRPGTAGTLFYEFREHVLKQGLRAYRATQLGVDIAEVEETTLYEKTQDTLAQGASSTKGPRGINHWRFTPKGATPTSVQAEKDTSTVLGAN